ITAMAVGQDVYCRFNSAVAPQSRGFAAAMTLGIFPTTLVAGRLLALTQAEMRHALGIASCGNGGVQEPVLRPGSDLRGMYTPLPARDGLLGALMAQRGIRSVESVFDGPAGLFKTFFRDEYNRAALIDGLGSDFTGQEVSYKPWPSSRVTHSYVDAALQL